MGSDVDPLADTRVRAAIAELQALITKQYPGSSFAVWVGLGEDTDGIYIEAAIDADDLSEVPDLYSDRLVDLQVDEGIPVRVLPVHPHERFAASFGAEPWPVKAA